MFNQIKYAFDDISNNKMKNIFLYIQIVVAMVLLSVLLNISGNTWNYYSKIKNIGNYQNMYIMFDQTDEDRLFNDLIYQKDITKRLKEFYLYLTQSSQFRSYTFDENTVSLTDKNGRTASIPLISANKNFIDIFKLKCFEGKIFSDGDYNGTGGSIPVIAGYEFSKSYAIGDEIRIDPSARYYIAGFLAQHSLYVDPKSKDRLSELDNSIIMPMQINRFQSFSDYDQPINRTVIVTDDKNSLRDIQDKSSSLGLFTYKFMSFGEKLSAIIESARRQVLYLGFLLALILIFTITGIVSNLLKFISDHIREFTIHIICGGQITSIIQRIALQVFLIIILADITALLIRKPDIISAITVAFNIFTGAFITIIPALKLKYIKISTLLRRS